MSETPLHAYVPSPSILGVDEMFARSSSSTPAKASPNYLIQPSPKFNTTEVNKGDLEKQEQAEHARQIQAINNYTNTVSAFRKNVSEERREARGDREAAARDRQQAARDRELGREDRALAAADRKMSNAVLTEIKGFMQTIASSHTTMNQHFGIDTLHAEDRQLSRHD